MGVGGDGGGCRHYSVHPRSAAATLHLIALMASGHQGAGSLVHGGEGWLVGLVYWREILPLLHLLSGRLHFSKLLKDPYPKTSTNFPTTSSSSSPAKVLQAPDCYQLEHFEDQTIYLFFLVTNQIRELRAVAVIG